MKKKIIYIGSGYFGYTGLKTFFQTPWINSFNIVGIVTVKNDYYANIIAKTLETPIWQNNNLDSKNFIK